LNRDMLVYQIESFEYTSDLTDCLEFELEYDEYLQPFIGTFRVKISAPDTCSTESYEGLNINFSINLVDFAKKSRAKTTFKLILDFIPKPLREKRLIFD
jgi:hypothetical protein